MPAMKGEGVERERERERERETEMGHKSIVGLLANIKENRKLWTYRNNNSPIWNYNR